MNPQTTLVGKYDHAASVFHGLERPTASVMRILKGDQPGYRLVGILRPYGRLNIFECDRSVRLVDDLA